MKLLLTLYLFSPLYLGAQDTVFLRHLRDEPRILSPVLFSIDDSAYQSILPRDAGNDAVVFLLQRLERPYRNKDIIETYYGSPLVKRLKFHVIISSDTMPVNHCDQCPVPYVVDHDSTKRFIGFGPDILAFRINDFFSKRLQASVNGSPVVINRIGIVFFDLFNRQYPCTLWPPTPPCRITQLPWKPEYVEIKNAFITVDGKEIEIAGIGIACKII